MSVSFPSPDFAYSGSRYNFVAAIYADNDVKNAYMLNNLQVRQFFYTNSLNKLVLEGQLEYIDLDGKIPNYLHSTFLCLYVGFAKLKEAVDGSIATAALDPKFSLKCTFIVDKIEIIGREENVVAYKFYLVSNNWLKCALTLDYSNYDADTSSIFSIINACILKNGLNTDLSCFEEADDDVKIHYITNGNDNLFTAVKYLLSRLYYAEKRDTSMKFLSYDEQAEKYKVFDVANTNYTKSGHNEIILALEKSVIEHIAYEQQNRLATVVNFPKTKLLNTIYTYNVATYSQDDNLLCSYTIKTDETVSYYNKFLIDEVDKKQKLSNFSAVKDIATNFIRRQTIWNNNMNLYNDIALDMTDDNALVVNTVGDILRKPSDVVYINFPQDFSKLKSENQQAYNDFNIRYEQLVGTWLTAKVVHIISPASKTYRLNLVLFKNFIEKQKDIQATNIDGTIA